MLRFCHGCGYQYEATGTAVEPVCQRPPGLCFQLSFHGANVCKCFVRCKCLFQKEEHASMIVYPDVARLKSAQG